MPCVLGGIVLALTLGFIGNAQAPAVDDDAVKSGARALKKALEQAGCMQDGKFNVADLFPIDDAGVAPFCFDNVPLSSSKSTTNPAVIAALAAKAYIWGLGPEYIERFSKYNTIIGAPFNALKYGAAASGLEQ